MVARTLAWAVLVLGVMHIVFGLARYNAALSGALADGFVGQFAAPEVRRTAFWFVMCGPLVMLLGHIALHAVTVGDREVLKLMGVYLLFFSTLGVAAFPRSPLWAPLLLAFPLIALGYGALPMPPKP